MQEAGCHDPGWNSPASSPRRGRGAAQPDRVRVQDDEIEPDSADVSANSEGQTLHPDKVDLGQVVLVEEEPCAR